MRSRSSRKLPPNVVTSTPHNSTFIKNVISEATTNTKRTTNSKGETQSRMRTTVRDLKSGSGIPRNVNSFIHLLNAQASNAAGVAWTLKLRSPSCNNLHAKAEPTTPQPFSVADKPLICQQKGRSSVDLDNRNELHKVGHLIRHRVGTPTGGASVFFETGLRSYANKNEGLRSLEKKWTTVPKTEKAGDLKLQLMYPSYEETRSIKSWSTKNTTIKMHSAYDGYTKFPVYGEDKSAPKNLAETGHLYRNKGQTMPLLNWQLSMRHYGGQNKVAIPEEQPSGELKVTKKPKRISGN